MDRAILPGSTPLERYLKTKQDPSSGLHILKKTGRKDSVRIITVTLNRCRGWKGHMRGLLEPLQPIL